MVKKSIIFVIIILLLAWTAVGQLAYTSSIFGFRIATETTNNIKVYQDCEFASISATEKDIESIVEKSIDQTLGNLTKNGNIILSEAQISIPRHKITPEKEQMVVCWNMTSNEPKVKKTIEWINTNAYEAFTAKKYDAIKREWT